MKNGNKVYLRRPRVERVWVWRVGLQTRGGEVRAQLHVGVCVWEVDTNMILFAIIGENLGLVESATVTSATIIGMIIVCLAIYTVYTGGFCDL